MPFIRGRYHMNPTVGDAIEAAREAEAALQALEHASKVARGDTDEEGADSYGNRAGGSRGTGASSATNAPGPIHRVEIEAAELVPSHSGRAQRGFVARIHRRPGIAAANGNGDSSEIFKTSPSSFSASHSAMHAAPPPETHVFADHHDLTNFLRDQFTDDCK